MTVLFKPDDLARTASGRTVRVENLNPDGSREVRDIKSGETYSIMPRHLFLVTPAIPKPWIKRTP